MLGGSRRSGTSRYRVLMGIASALWLIAAIGAVIDGDTLMAISWFGFVGFGGLVASGAYERSQGIYYLAVGLLVVAVAISMGVFLAD